MEMFSESDVLVIEVNSDEQFFELFEKVHDEALQAIRATRDAEQQQAAETFKRPHTPPRTPPRALERKADITEGRGTTMENEQQTKRRKKTKGKGALERRRERRRLRKEADRKEHHRSTPGAPLQDHRTCKITPEEKRRRQENMRRLFGEDWRSTGIFFPFCRFVCPDARIFIFLF